MSLRNWYQRPLGQQLAAAEEAAESNTTPACAFRGFGTPQINWAVEGNMDAGARALGIDRAEIRLRNLATRGDEVVKDDTPADGLWPQAVRAAMDAIGWDTPVPEGRGRGIAVGIKSSATTGLSYATVRLLADGSVREAALVNLPILYQLTAGATLIAKALGSVFLMMLLRSSSSGL